MRETARNRIVKMVFIAMLLIIASNIVLAIGIGPSRQYVSFTPGETIDSELLVINDRHQNFTAEVGVQGELIDYVEIGTHLVEVTSDDSLVKIPFTIRFPEQEPKPGEHEIEIVVEQLPAAAESQQGTFVSANIALISQLIVRVPYPGKYADGKMFISGNENQDMPTRFTLMIYNFGKEDIGNTYSQIEILNQDNEKVAEVVTSSKQIMSKQEVKLEGLWEPEIGKGTYNAIATIYYDDLHFKIEKEFNLGIFAIYVTDIYVKQFRLGEIAKFEIILENSWNTEVEDVYAEFMVEDSAGRNVAQYQTEKIDIAANSVGQLEAYWDTAGLETGIYKVVLLTHYAGKTTQSEYEFEVGLDGIILVGEEEIEEKASTTPVLVALIIVVVLLMAVMNALWLYFAYKKSKKSNKKGGRK
jgi:hypothetical protein